MKKFLFSICLLLAVAVTAEAQIRPPHPRHRHHPRRTIVQPRQKVAPERIYSPIGEFRFHVYGELGSNDFGAGFMHESPYHFSVGGMAEYQV